MRRIISTKIVLISKSRRVSRLGVLFSPHSLSTFSRQSIEHTVTTKDVWDALAQANASEGILRKYDVWDTFVRLKYTGDSIQNFCTAVRTSIMLDCAQVITLDEDMKSEKFGQDAPLRAIFESRKLTRETAPLGGDEDLVLTRVLWLDGVEEGNTNTKERYTNTKERYIYIHGTNQEDLVGQKASRGCLRIRNGHAETF